MTSNPGIIAPDNTQWQKSGAVSAHRGRRVVTLVRSADQRRAGNQIAEIEAADGTPARQGTKVTMSKSTWR